MKEYSDREHIKLNRKILNWEWYSDPCTRDVFVHCLLKANWKDGKWHGYDYKRGQFITSLPTLASELGFSIQNIRTAIKNLKSTGELTDWHDSKIRIITVVKYDEYQSTNRHPNMRPTGNQQTANRRPTAVKEYKEYKEYKEDRTASSGANAPSSAPREKSIYERMRE